MKPRHLFFLCLLLPLLHLHLRAEVVLLPRDSRLIPLQSATTTDILLRADPDGNMYGLTGNGCVRIADSALLFSFQQDISVRDMQCLGNDRFLLAVDSSVVFYRLGERTFQPLCRTDAPVAAFYADSTGCIAAMDKRLMLYTADGRRILLHHTTDTLTSLAQSDEGLLFYGTLSSMYMLDSAMQAVPVINKGVRRLTVIGNNLFVAFADSTEAVLTDIGGYKALADSICLMRSRLPVTLKNYQTTILNDGDSVDMRDVTFAVIPGHGLFAVIQNRFVSMEQQADSEIEYAFPDTTYVIDEVVFLPSIAVYKSDNNLLYVNEQQRTRGFAFETDSFHIAMASDTSIYMFAESAVWECNPRRPSPRLVTRSMGGEQVIRFQPLHKDTLVITVHTIYTLSDTGLRLLLSIPSGITAAYAGLHGIWIGTDNGLYRYRSKEGLIQAAQTPVRQILGDGDCLYIITGNSSIYRLQRQQTEKPDKHKSKSPKPKRQRNITAKTKK